MERKERDKEKGFVSSGHKTASLVHSDTPSFSDPKKPSKNVDLPLKDVGTKSSQWESHTYSGQSQVAFDEQKLSKQEIEKLTYSIIQMQWQCIKLLVVVRILNIPSNVLSDRVLFRKEELVNAVFLKRFFAVYNVSGYFRRTNLEESLAVVCHTDDEIKTIQEILTNGKQGLPSSYKLSVAEVTTERCFKDPQKKSKTFDLSDKDQIATIADSTPLSSVEIDVLTIHISKSWRKIADKLGVDISKIGDMFSFYDIPNYDFRNDGICRAAIMLYLYNESDNFSRKKLVKSCAKYGIFDVKERLKRVRLLKDSLDNNRKKFGDPSVSDTMRLSWWEMDELSLGISGDQLAAALHLKVDLTFLEVIWMHPSPAAAAAAAALYAYNESPCFSRKTLGKCFEKMNRGDLQVRLESMQNDRLNAPDLGGLKTRPEQRLSRQEIENLSKYVFDRWISLAHMLDTPIITAITRYRFYRSYIFNDASATVVLCLYNESRHFSRENLKKCCKNFPRFQQISKILENSMEDKAIMRERSTSTARRKGPSLKEGAKKCQIDKNTFQHVKARSLALRFMAANPSCVRAIPYQANKDDKSIIMCLYLHTYGNDISADIYKAAEDMFAEYRLEYFDLGRKPLGEHVAPRFGNSPSETKELGDLAALVENDLPMFENRLNVTAVQPSYKFSSSLGKDELCVTVYVLGKGKIPVGEQEFSKQDRVGNCPLNISEGYFVPTGSPFPFRYGARPLHFGVGIGVQGEIGAGTLGAFLKDEEDNKYILSCEHVLGKGSRDAVSMIVQPAEDDSEYVENELSRKLERITAQIEDKTQRMQEALDERDKNKLSKRITRLNRELDDYKERRDDAVSRDIATYSSGFRGNWDYNGHGKIFVDVAVAQLKEQEAEEIVLEAEDKGTVFGFDDKKSINGNIIDWCGFEGDKSEIKFWKSGRTTEHTEGGRLYRSSFFVNQVGYNQVPCLGELSHCNFMAFCESCAAQQEIDLVDVSLLEQEELECAGCNDPIREEERRWRLWARNCFIILDLHKPFSDTGDSGSVVFDYDGNAWGIIIGSFISGHYVHSVVVPLDIAIKSLEQQTGKKFSIWCAD